MTRASGEEVGAALAGALELLLVAPLRHPAVVAAQQHLGHVVRGLPQQVVLVTHHLDLLADFDRVLVFDRSRLVHDGAPADAIAHYLRLMDDDR